MTNRELPESHGEPWRAGFWKDIARAKRAVGWSMTPPPPVVHQQVLAMFADAHSVAEPRIRAVAQRVRDRELLVVRDDDRSEHRVFTSEIADVTLTVVDGVISGQVIPIERPTPAAFAVTVIDGPTGARSYEGDEFGSFVLPTLPAGDYRILLDNTHLEIELEVEVGPSIP